MLRTRLQGIQVQAWKASSVNNITGCEILKCPSNWRVGDVAPLRGVGFKEMEEGGWSSRLGEIVPRRWRLQQVQAERRFYCLYGLCE